MKGFFNDMDSFRVNNEGIYETGMRRRLNEIKIAHQFDFAVYKLDWDFLYRKFIGVILRKWK